MNYLALLGWAPADGREVLTRDEIVAEFDLDRVTPLGGVLRRQEARLAERRVHPTRCRLDELVARLDDRSPRRGWSRARRRDVAGGGRGSARNGLRRLVALVEQTEFLFAAATTSRSPTTSGTPCATTERAPEVLDAVDRTPRDVSSGRVERPGPARRRSTRSASSPARSCSCSTSRSRAGRAGLPLFDSMHLLGRDATPRPARAPPGSESGTATAAAKIAPPIRGWCNRQHNRFWSCLWGFESSPPSPPGASCPEAVRPRRLVA